MSPLLALSAALLAVGALGIVFLRLPSAVLVTLGIVTAVFSGHSADMGLPLPIDRVLIYVGLLVLLLGNERSQLPFRLRFRSQHAMMIALSVYALISSLVAGTFLGHIEGHYALLDRLSITAFVLFSVAPLVFHDARTRNILLVAMVATGAYLGVTALLEGVGLKSLTFPRYINDPNVGIHFDRARGPITESAGFGLALFECAMVAVVASRVWRTQSARVSAMVVALLCLLGTIFTLTRAVWIGVVLGMLAACVVSREWRRRVLPVAAVVVVVLVAALSFSPTLSQQVEDRGGAERSVWDRLNLADAGLNALEDHPLFGIGYRAFPEQGTQYFRLLPDIPQTGTGLDIHNAVLAYAAELGLVGVTMWLLVVAVTVGAAMVRRAPPVLEDWRVAMVAMGVQWGVVAMFTPLSYTFSFLILWTWAGIVIGHHFVRPRRPADAGPVALSPAPEEEADGRVHA